VQDIHKKYGPRFEGLDSREKSVDRLCELNVIEQALNVCQTTVVQDAWARGHQVTVHGWIYRLQDGELRDLGASASSAEDVEAAIQRACDRLSAS
jgi:carbonic anhydrase